MKKSNVLIRFLMIILVVFALTLPSFAMAYTPTWASEGATGSIDAFVSQVQSDKSTDLSKIELYAGGMPFGVKIMSKGLMVVGFSSTSGKNVSPAFKSGVRIGDLIIKVNSKDITTIDDFVSIVSSSADSEITLNVLRGSNEMTFSFKPVFSTDDGTYKTGIFVKDSTSGIGTVTFINPVTGAFGGLGHGICDSSSGKLVSLARGVVMDVTINGVLKGKCGDAGELKGVFNAKKIGSLSRNSSNGVFGIISLNSVNSPESKMHVCPKEEIKEGEAYIWCTLDENGPQKYAVSISDIDLTSSTVKNFRVKVTDPKLLLKTGGIVQGMSGSPIIQNGRIIGAVTHVLINDPTQGYGIFIENMLSSMPSMLQP
jgi:stage IV sporulation protein B